MGIILQDLPREPIGIYVGGALLLAFILLILYAIFSPTKTAIAHWHHSFDNFDYAPLEFYQIAKEALEKRQIPTVSFTDITHFEQGIFGNRRQYLRLKWKNYYIDICAAPYGSGFYVSWYLIEKRSFLNGMLRRWKWLSAIMDMKTYYQMDTQIMFKEFVHAGLMEAVKAITESKGVRLSDADLKYINANTKGVFE